VEASEVDVVALVEEDRSRHEADIVGDTEVDVDAATRLTKL
jgi:hypothetical protein